MNKNRVYTVIIYCVNNFLFFFFSLLYQTLPLPQHLQQTSAVEKVDFFM